MNAWVMVRAAIAPLNAEPRLASEQVSQTLAGHWLEVLEERALWLRVRARDGYEGWLHQGYCAEPASRTAAHPPASAHGQTSPRATPLPDDARRVSLGCTVCDHDGRRQVLPLGALVADSCHVEDGDALTPSEMRARFPRTPFAIARTALALFEGTAYQWGGITPWGADCSGFVQTCFGLHGIALPRDARQQAEMGADAGGKLEALHPADLLFFSERDDGRITHVAIALGQMRLVHLALGRGGYSVERLEDAADPYVAALKKTFRCARRVAAD